LAACLLDDRQCSLDAGMDPAGFSIESFQHQRFQCIEVIVNGGCAGNASFEVVCRLREDLCQASALSGKDVH
jgi:hypothetical protein